MFKKIYEKLMEKPSASFAYLAFCPFWFFALLFLQKILSFKHFTFSDDFQMLSWFHTGKFAFPFMELLNSSIDYGRFFPLFYQNFNILSLLNSNVNLGNMAAYLLSLTGISYIRSDLTLDNLAERCFYVQAGMWLLTCMMFFALMAYIAKHAKENPPVLLFLFIPLSLLTMLITSSFSGYFLLLIFPETLLCVLFPAFLLFYYIGFRKDNSYALILAWIAATLSLFCKENTFCFFAVLCAFWFVFGRKELTRKHCFFLIGLVISIAAFLLMYYFIVYRHAAHFYNRDHEFGSFRDIFIHVKHIFMTSYIWLIAFLFGIFRFIRVLFYRERKHFFMDAVLFSTLALFISFLILKLVNPQFFAAATIFIFPVFLHYLLSYDRLLLRIGLFLALILMIRGNISYALSSGYTFAQQQDHAFLETVINQPDCREVLFVVPTAELAKTPSMEWRLLVLRTFLSKMDHNKRWSERNIRMIHGIPDKIDKNAIYITEGEKFFSDKTFYTEFCRKMLDQNFWKTKECSLFTLFAPMDPVTLPCSLLSNDGRLNFSGAGMFVNTSPYGRWMEKKDVNIYIPLKAVQNRPVQLAVTGFPIINEKLPHNAVDISVNGKQIQTVSLFRRMGAIRAEIPAGIMQEGKNVITLHFQRSPSDVGLMPVNQEVIFFIQRVSLCCREEEDQKNKGILETSKQMNIRDHAEKIKSAACSR